MSEGTGAGSPAPTPLSELAESIRAELGAIDEDNRSSLTHAIRAGEMLIQARSQAEHGEWLPWLTGTGITQRTASDYMRLGANQQRAASFDSIREALAAIPAKQQRKTKRRGEPTITGPKGEAQNPAVVNWVRTQTRRGLGTKEIVASSQAGEDGWPGGKKGLSDGSLASVRAAIVAEDRVRAEMQQQAPGRRRATEGGKRLRQLHADKRAGRRDPESAAWKMQVAIAEAVSVLECVDIPELEWSETVDHILGEMVYDLERHRGWSDRQFDAAWAHMDDVSRQRRLREVRKRANDPSSTQWERENAARLADKLERKYREQKSLGA